MRARNESGALPYPPAASRAGPLSGSKPFPKGPRSQMRSPGRRSCIAPVNGPTLAIIRAIGSASARLNGFSSTPGSQAMTNCPGLASICPSRRYVRVLSFSSITAVMRRARGSPSPFMSDPSNFVKRLVVVFSHEGADFLVDASENLRSVPVNSRADSDGCGLQP